MSEPTSAYKNVVERREFEKGKLSSDRFQSILSREDRSELPPEVWGQLAVKHAYKSSWRGLLLNKGPFELATYPMLIDELRPLTIIEFGALNGGSAVWMADFSAALGLIPKIISIDLDLSLLDESARSDARIEFVEGDANAVDQFLTPEVLANCLHPWLIIEDCHVNTIGILNHLDTKGLQPGDYVIVEDTNQDAWDAWRLEWMSEDRVLRGKAKLIDLRAWLINHPNYLIDSFYQDFYGYNVAKNWNSILKYTGF
jgi:cephalosporin hydroxylase